MFLKAAVYSPPDNWRKLFLIADNIQTQKDSPVHMSIRANNLTPGDVYHPGTILADELSARSLTRKVFAGMIGIRTNVLNELIKGKRNFTVEIAVKIEKALHIPAKIWMRIQERYDKFTPVN